MFEINTAETSVISIFFNLTLLIIIYRRPMQDYIIKIYNDFSYLRVWVLLETRGNRTLPEIYHLHNTLEPCKMMTIVP